MVMGNRFKGRIAGDMPLKHRYLGNPVLSKMGQVVFGVPVSDFSLRAAGVSQGSVRMDIRTTGEWSLPARS